MANLVFICGCNLGLRIQATVTVAAGAVDIVRQRQWRSRNSFCKFSIVRASAVGNCGQFGAAASVESIPKYCESCVMIRLISN